MTNSLRNPMKSLSSLTHASPSGWISMASAAVAMLAVACGGTGGSASDGPVDTSEVVGTAHAAIYSGTQDDDQSGNTSVVSLKIGSGTSFELCSGSLIAPNVVLTARHCVGKNLTATVSCDENGTSGNGQHMGDDEDPASIHVFVGANPDFARTADANGQAIFHDEGGILCNADIALLVLDASITSVAPMKVRLSGVTDTTETVRSVGFGQNDQSLPVGTRLRKDNVPVLAVGQTLSKSMTPLGSHEFEVGLSICQGDSGGPAISETTGAVIGVVSRGGNCTDNFGHIYTSTIGFGPIFQNAFAAAGGAPIDEGGSASPLSSDADNASGNGSAESRANKLDAGANAQACAVSISGTAQVSNWGLAMGLGAFGLFVARRRRR